MELLLDNKTPPIEKAPYQKAHPTGKLIALVGCDGSGKSSLTTDLIAAIQKYTPVKRYYLGLGSGDLGRKIGQIPVVGSWIENLLKQRRLPLGQKAKDTGCYDGISRLFFLFAAFLFLSQNETRLKGWYYGYHRPLSTG